MLPARSTPFPATTPSAPSSLGEAKRIDMKPRLAGARTNEVSPGEDVAVLHFTCPACLVMLSAPRSLAAGAVVCQACHVSVQPPQVVSSPSPSAQGKSALPPPQKNGIPVLRHSK